jgi:signal transduction histidine kinase/ligand-binding sensor domain-containing protein
MGLIRRIVHRISLVLVAVAVAVAMACLPAPARAVDPEQQLAQYRHGAWRWQDGELPGAPMAITQGRDGYLWVGTVNGLVRFDGQRFVPWMPPKGTSLPSESILRLRAGPDGSLWIGTQQGLARWKGDTLLSIPASPGGAIASITPDARDGIWFTRVPRPDAKEQVCHVSGSGELRCYGAADGLTLIDDPCCPLGFFQDAAGTTWIGSDTALSAWRDNSTTPYKRDFQRAHKDIGVSAIAPRAGGGLWVGLEKAGPGLGLEHFEDGQWRSLVVGGIDTSTLSVAALLVDVHGSLWIGTQAQGLYRLQGNRLDHFDSTYGLSNDRINGLYEDAEGNIWVATSGGLDRFSDRRVVTFGKQQGLTGQTASTVAASRDGSIYVGSAGLNVLRDGQLSSLAPEGLPEGLVTDVLEDHAGRLWIGVSRTLSILDRGKLIAVRGKNGSTDIAQFNSLGEDVAHDVWGRSSSALFRIRGDVVVDEFPLGPEFEGRQVIADELGRVWLGLRSGDLAQFRDGKASLVAFKRPAGAAVGGFVEHMATTSGAVYGATANGLVAWRNGAAQTMTMANGLPCNNAHAPIVDRAGNLWLLMQCGLVSVPAAELQRWWQDPTAKLRLQVYDGIDGVDPGWAPFRAAALAPDGRLWFANGRNVQVIDPSQPDSRRPAPPVHVETLLADRRTYSLQGLAELPPRIRDLQIDFTAASFALPQRVQFRYKLLGRDRDWQTPVTRRQAFYTDLSPGTYRFVVTARSDGGPWNSKGDAISFRIAPAWYQTTAFRLVVPLIALLLAWALYRWRMRRMSMEMSARFDERLSERVRLARELHDTLLQTVQAGKLVADDALEPSVDEERRRHALQRISSWLGEAIRDGRAALDALRQSTALENDLAQALRECADELAVDKGIAVKMSVHGSTRDLHPIARDEIFRIGSEAIRNAIAHSGSKQLELELAYDHDLSLIVRDFGKGIAIDFGGGKAGHFGLQGMRERAQRIGAKFTITRLNPGGTEVRLQVPGKSLFR